MRIIVQLTSWGLCFSFMLYIPVLLALREQSLNPPFKAETVSSAWAIPTVSDRLDFKSLITSNLSFVQHSRNATSPGPSEPQGKLRPGPTEDGEVYLVMDLSRNRLLVKRGERTLHSAVASAGSGRTLHDPRNPSHWWKFDTPQGYFEIQSKLIDPVWIQPDWAFIERGQPVPSDQGSRLRRGVLGEYALGFGNGYFIHGALYTNLLGTNYTHGCIQLGDEDLRLIYHAIPLGTKLVIVSQKN